MVFDPILPWPLILGLGGALLGFSIWTYWSVQRGRSILWTTRTLAVLLIVAIMLRPSLLIPREDERQATVAVLVDTSKSMQLADEAAGRSRFEAVQWDVDQARPIVESLSQKIQFRWFDFGSAVAESSPEALADAEPQQERTAVGDSLAEIQRQLASDRLLGVVLLTDGTNTTGSSPLNVARQFRAMGVPIHTFGYGQEVVSTEARDLVALAIRTNPTVFAKNRLMATGEFDVSGFGKTPVDVRLLFDGVEKANGRFETVEQAHRLLADLQAIPISPGDLKVTIEARVDGDRQTANNSVSTWVTVQSGGISVLHIEGKYRFWEPKFLRWALDRSPDIDLNQLYLLETDPTGTDPLADLIEPGRVDVYILGDIAADQFDTRTLEQIARNVEQSGAGLIMIGGYDAFGPGGWGTSPLAPLFPVNVRPTDPQRSEPLAMMPTDAGRRHFILRLDADDGANQQIWSQLRPLDGGSSWSSLKPGAQLLAATPSGVEILAAQTVGAGRTLAFAGDTTWRWRQSQSSIDHHARFWRQLILWLAKKEEVGSNQLKVTLPTRRIALGQSLPITVRAVAGDGAPLENAQVQATVELPDGSSVPVELFEEKGAFEGTFWQSDQPGDLTLRITGVADGKDLGESTMKFLVYSVDAEAQQSAADLSMLETMAETTAGTFHRHLELADFLKEFSQRKLRPKFSQPVTIPLWDRWEVLTLFLILMAVEWTTRKRLGLA